MSRTPSMPGNRSAAVSLALAACMALWTTPAVMVEASSPEVKTINGNVRVMVDEGAKLEVGVRASDGSVKVRAVLTETDAAAIVEGYEKKLKESSAALDQLKLDNAAALDLALDQLKKDFAASLEAKVGAVSISVAKSVAKVEEGLAAVSKEAKVGFKNVSKVTDELEEGLAAVSKEVKVGFKNVSKVTDELRKTVEKKECGVYRFTSCQEAHLEGCTSGTYTLNTRGLAWRTTCSMNKYGGWTMIGFLARNFRTRNRMKYWQNYPDARVDRRLGETIMFKGDMRGFDLKGTQGVIMEGVDCRGGGESVGVNCKWVHSNKVPCDSACKAKVRQSWGYGWNRQGLSNCRKGTTIGSGTAPSGRNACTPYNSYSSTILGWQVDVHYRGNCWAGRGTCCSNSGGSGRCQNGDSNGGAYAMLWVR